MGRILPIFFNGDMIRAILQESPRNKTATRRAVRGYIPEDAIWGYTIFTPKGYISCRGSFADGYGEKFIKLPYQNGDILYVRETYAFIPCVECMQDDDGKCLCNKEPVIHEDKYSVSEGCFVYQADCPEEDKGCIIWSPSIHMPKQAARVWLEVTDVSVERLKDIDTMGCQQEGIDISRGSVFKRFSELWDSTIQKAKIDRYGWRANPWVWVIRFERCGKPEGQ